MAGGCNKFSFVDPGHIFGWNLMKLGMGPLFDMLYREKWSNSVRQPTGRQNRRTFFHVLGHLESICKKFFSGKIFIQKNFRDLSQEHLSPLFFMSNKGLIPSFIKFHPKIWPGSKKENLLQPTAISVPPSLCC